MTGNLAFRARRAVVGDTERACLVRVADGRILAIDAFDAPAGDADVVVLGEDEVLLPGLVDTHVHVNEPGRTEWEGFATATAAAAAGGITTIIDMPLNSVPPTTTVEHLEVKRACARDQARIDIGFWGGAVPGNTGAGADDIAALHDAGVFGFKCFLVDSGVPEFPPLDPDGFDAAMAETARLGALLIVHAEDADAIDAAPPAHGPDYASFLRSRPPAAEERAIRQVIDTARRHGGRAHVLHLSDAGALDDLRAARRDTDISAETCPHYLALDAEHVPPGATEFKCCPPIREGANREALWRALDAGEIDMVVSDHSPCTAELKRRGGGDFGAAWGGIASLQLALPVVWTAARERGHTLAEVVRWMAGAPADRVGLAAKGRIAVGADADVCVFAADDTFVVDPARLHHRNPVTAYAGRTLRGVVRSTWLRGERVTTDERPRGRLLERGNR